MARRLTLSLMLIAVSMTDRPLPAQITTAQPHQVALDRYVAPLVDLKVFSGTILVARGDRVILERSYGLADMEQGIPVRSSTVFRIASISKSFTRALVGRLVDQRQLTLDDPLSQWLPAMPSANKITIRMLLDHRAGIPNMNSLPYDEEAFEPNTLARLVDSIARTPLDFQPGARERYSNGGYAILARVIELVTKRPFEESLEREILRPLHLHQTHHEADGMIIRGLARGYMPSADDADRTVIAPFQEMNTKAGGGSLVSTPRDLVTWVRSIGMSPILKDATWKELFPDKDSTFAYQGRSPGYNVIVRHDRQRDITTVVLANNYSAGMVADVARGAEAIASGKSPEALAVSAPTKVSGAEMRALAGKYRVPERSLPIPPGTSVELRASGDQVVIYLGAVPVDVLIPQAPRLYLARALWSLVDARKNGSTVDSLEIRALYRESKVVAKRINQ